MTLDRYHRTYGRDLVDNTKKKVNSLLMQLSNQRTKEAIRPQQQIAPDLNATSRMGDTQFG